MKKLSQEKLKQLGLVTAAGAGVLAGLWFGLIKHQLKTIDELRQKKVTAEATLKKETNTVIGGSQLDSQVIDLHDQLESNEQDMALGDLNSWFFSFLRKYKSAYRVEIPQFGSAEVGEVKLLPGFPYKQATISVGGTAYFHDLGKFIADFENQYPYAQVLNLDLQPGPAQSQSEKEKLSFRMDIAVLVRPGPSH
jgi:hypothetical protein